MDRRGDSLLACCMLLALLAAACAAPVQASGGATLAPPVMEVRTLLRQGDVDGAADAAERVVATLADDAQAWLWAGRAYGRKAMASGLFGKAKWASRTRDALEQAVALDPRLIDARLDLLSFYRFAPGIMGGGRDKAEAQAAAIAQQDASMGKFAEANLYFGEDQARGEALLREALALDAGNGRARFALASMAMQRKEWAAARALWSTVLDHPEQGASARYQLAKIAALSGESLEEGLAHIDRFIADGELPEDLSIPSAQWRRGQILEQLGRREEAIAAMELGLQDSSVRAMAEADLARIRGE